MTNHQFFFQFNSISSIFLKFFQLGQPGKYAPTNLGTQVSDLVGCPYACENGTYAASTEKRIKLCTTCPPGHYCDDVASHPSACAPGYWNSYVGQTSFHLVGPALRVLLKNIKVKHFVCLVYQENG